MVLAQFGDFLILLLLAAAAVAGALGELAEAAAIMAIVVLNAALACAQEWRAERAMAALRRLAAPTARVRRDGEIGAISADLLAPGDVVLLEAGNIVPADLRLAEAVQLRIAESALTGESAPVDKRCAPLADARRALAERDNMAYRGTIVTHGRALGIVVATGSQTELGRIAGLLTDVGVEKTPLQRRLARFGTGLAWVVLTLCAAIFGIGLLQGGRPLDMLLTSVSLAVAAIPEALPAVVGIALALGARRMAQQQALVRQLPAVEALGSTTFICADKTGTLTCNRMRAESFWVDGVRQAQPQAGGSWPLLLQAIALNNDVACEGGALVGDPTEVALVEAARAAGLDKLTCGQRHPRIGEVPFDADRQRMTTFHRDDAATVAFVKGAPEAVLSLCERHWLNGAMRPIERRRCLEEAERMAGEGLRVLAVAARRLDPERRPSAADESDLELLGLVGLLDPPRPEVAGAVAQCKSAGIVPVMITGDHRATAWAIARRLGICDDDSQVVAGAELAALDDPALERRVLSLRVYARVSPDQKIRIVQALQRRGQVVAMTGDGINDAPALRGADIGVAMGLNGTDVAREAAHLVLLDDNCATIVRAVCEGRRIVDNIRKFVQYVLGGNAGEIGTIAAAQALGMPLPLLPIQILWINFVTDGLPGLAMTAESAEPGVMLRPPRLLSEGIMNRRDWLQVLWAGFGISGASLLAYRMGSAVDPAQGRTMAFTVLTLCQLGYALGVRSGAGPGGTRRPNLLLLGVIAFTMLLQVAALYLAPLAGVLGTVPLGATQFAWCMALAGSVSASLAWTGRAVSKARRAA